jgi:hypothetical protein
LILSWLSKEKLLEDHCLDDDDDDNNMDDVGEEEGLLSRSLPDDVVPTMSSMHVTM